MELVFHRAREGGEKDIPKRRDDWERQRRRPRIESTPGASTRGRGGPAGSSSAYDLGSADRRRAGSIIYQARDGEESDLGSLACAIYAVHKA
jgi:hypothetical protein